MARVITNVQDFEQWRSAIAGTVVLKRFDRKGDLIDEVIPAGKTVSLLPEERRVNQEMAADSTLDPFQNGILVPVKLIETADDIEELKGNPNHITDADMRKLLANPKALDALEAGIAGVSNPIALQRMLEIARDPEVDATLRQVETIRKRLSEVGSEPTYVEVETVMTPDGRPVVQTAAPESPDPNLSKEQNAARKRPQTR